MLPAPPKSLGRLGDVLISALQAVRGETNTLGLSSKKSICVILIDGLGTHNLAKAAGHARFLNSQTSATAACWFPATTSASITSFATGKHPADIGFIGYQVFDKKSEQPMNLLSGWKDYHAGASYQDQPTISELAVDSGISFHTVAPSSYESSGFTGASMRGTNYHGKDRIEDRFSTAQKLLSDSQPKVVYLYIPELDQIAHAYGSENTTWLNQIEEVDSLVSDFVQALPKQAGAVLTADHGVIDIKPDSHVFLDELLPADEVHYVGGDTRAPFIYLKPSIDITKVRSLLEEALGNVAYVVSTQELVDAGYWKLSAKSADVFPDLVLIARKEVVFYHRAFAKRKSLEMIGHHGALTAQEMSIPLITFGF
jgi:predicted AlkP superfamily pyrophosphatase or phosphodiesterase